MQTTAALRDLPQQTHGKFLFGLGVALSVLDIYRKIGAVQWKNKHLFKRNVYLEPF